jgi:hypothetical protein
MSTTMFRLQLVGSLAVGAIGTLNLLLEYGNVAIGVLQISLGMFMIVSAAVQYGGCKQP